jgi:AraC-like DNA-binding protein
LSEIFKAIKNNNLSKDQFNFLFNKIRGIIIHSQFRIELKELDDYIMEIISKLTEHLKGDNLIENPDAYLRKIIHNYLTHTDLNSTEINKLISNLREIIDDLEKQEIIYSYNNRRFLYVFGNDSDTDKLTKEEIIQRVYGYDFTEINKENQWNETKKNLIKKFIVDFLNDVKIIEFNTLVEILKIKLNLNVVFVDDLKVNNDDDTEDDPSFPDKPLPISTVDVMKMQEIKEYSEIYKSKLQELFKTKRGKVIIRSLYYRHYEEKTFEDIAALLNYSSPTTIQTQLKNFYEYTPEGFLKQITVLDEKIQNPFEFANLFIDLLLRVLKDVFEQVNEKDNE